MIEIGVIMELEHIIDQLKEPLKNSGYKKKGCSWYKICGGLTVVFSVQKSQYGSDVWYYNFGTGINVLEEKPVSAISKCHVTQRLDRTINGRELTPEVLIQAVLRWEQDYGDMNRLRIRALENRLPRTTAKKAITWLTTVKL